MKNHFHKILDRLENGRYVAVFVSILAVGILIFFWMRARRLKNSSHKTPVFRKKGHPVAVKS
jgi:hypothetical protein